MKPMTTITRCEPFNGLWEIEFILFNKFVCSGTLIDGNMSKEEIEEHFEKTLLNDFKALNEK